jgi:hypothetical protein
MVFQNHYYLHIFDILINSKFKFLIFFCVIISDSFTFVYNVILQKKTKIRKIILIDFK